MEISLFNTKSKKIEVFKPIKSGHVSMYHCGPTVYQRAHIGNLRAYVFADIIRRTFEYRGYRIHQVINITDVGHLTNDSDAGDDKVEKEAAKQNISAQTLTQHFTSLFQQDIGSLNINTDTTLFPKASDHIDEQISLIKALEIKGHTYITSDGVYFDTKTFPSYGYLGGIDLEGLQAGARVEQSHEKHNPTDFALWKFSPKTTHRQQEWESPWGVGFPGWHIECSAMSMKYLGVTFDIHTGGIDHIPVHHNNEIAQSEAANNAPLAHYWLHNNFILIDNQKVAKSIGNTLSLDEIRSRNINVLAYRYWLLTAHYRSEVSFSFEALTAASHAYEKLSTLYSKLHASCSLFDTLRNYLFPPRTLLEKIVAPLSHDFDTPKAIASLWEILKDTNIPEYKKYTVLSTANTVLGLGLTHTKKNTPLPDNVVELIAKRDHARASKDWGTSDVLRKELEALGYTVTDTQNGTKVD